MQTLFRQYRPFLLFLLKFLGVYIVLTLLYQLFLGSYDERIHEIDAMTRLVSEQVVGVLQLSGYDASMLPHESEASYRVLVGGKTVVRVIEGCNAISLMILFTAFIVAFGSTFKKTGLFILGGLVLIHLLNVARIALLTIGIRTYPESQALMHDILFPLVIYGTIFLLWVLWIRKFSPHARKKA
ncbi:MULTISPECIES: exosortase family protein XrtF [unclassified Flavobacterium]|uniref:exosortase family protein XrtF n=1 Tax=unclassified Flavobacterium TaxID=196869 RepID=UPI001F1410D7|nr:MULTISPECIES: exosortase family protein XrtF [unclassified Flavobacterium]UMY66830.1 exosortase family protein XrtF [Flavobacterium sp. HJ-32-4]